MKYLAALILLFSLTALFGCTNAAVRRMPINHVDLSRVKDGDYAYGGFSYEVKVSVASHQIKDVAIIKNRTTTHAKMAEGVVKRILEQQKNDVDTISGATTTSKALLKATENALAKGQ